MRERAERRRGEREARRLICLGEEEARWGEEEGVGDARRAMSDDEEARMDSVGPGEERDAADGELVRVCGSSHLADLARRIWREMEKEQLLDASDQRLVDEDVRKLMNGLHTCVSRRGRAGGARLVAD